MMKASTPKNWRLSAKAYIISVMLAVAVILPGCQTTKTVTKIEYQRVEVPESLLKCLPEPEAKAAWTKQRQVALYRVKLSEAGEDCRLKLAAVKKIIEAASEAPDNSSGARRG